MFFNLLLFDPLILHPYYLLNMRFQNNISLLQKNTFGIEAIAKYYVEISCQDDLNNLLESKIYKESNHLVLGGGSNILLTKDFDGLVIKNCIKGIEIVKEEDRHIWLKVGAGVVWHEFVIDCINNERGGIENLSLIPGTVGAAPMQNIGAYGVEIKDVFASLQAVHKITGELHTFDNIQCRFGYRDSIFKLEVKNQFIITSATFKLTKYNHKLNISYGAIKETLKNRGIASPTIKDVSQAVIEIRQSKLPDPKKIGNAGSFFKNPSINKAAYEELQQKFSDIPGYQQPNQLIKVPAGWLIEQCGWKGKTLGNIGVHKDQALVLVNYGNGAGNEIGKLALEIQQSVIDKFGIKLTPEVNFVPALN
jgi:UDP-N-acetylmuramate dehydrogenase